VTRYDRDKHHRRSIRLWGYDYAKPGAYFVTIVTHNRKMLFDDPVFRQVVETMWQRIPRHSPHVELDEWVVMPNHVHGVIVIVDDPHSRGE
jgi:putative transposase